MLAGDKDEADQVTQGIGQYEAAHINFETHPGSLENSVPNRP